MLLVSVILVLGDSMEVSMMVSGGGVALRRDEVSPVEILCSVDMLVKQKRTHCLIPRKWFVGAFDETSLRLPV